MGGISMWVARDVNGSLWFYREKPVKVRGYWRIKFLDESNAMYITSSASYLPEVKPEDEEPTEVILKIDKE